jgi:hypothetical protein
MVPVVSSDRFDSGIIPTAYSQSRTKDGEWLSCGADLGYTRYAPLDQIDGYFPGMACPTGPTANCFVGIWDR